MSNFPESCSRKTLFLAFIFFAMGEFMFGDIALFLAKPKTTTSAAAVTVKNSDVASPKGKKTPLPPAFFVNFGPKKTGTTTIQCAFSLSSNLLAAYSSYRYLGRAGVRSCQNPVQDELFQPNISDTVESVQKLSNAALLHLREGNSPIFSSERMSEMDKIKSAAVASLVHTVKKAGFAVKPILIYRRFYQWIPSYYNQKINVIKTFEENGAIFRHRDCFISMSSWFDRMPNCGGFKDYAPGSHPVQFISFFLNRTLGLDDILLMNMHLSIPDDEGEILSSFVRQVLPGSEKFRSKFVEEFNMTSMNTGAEKSTNLYHLAIAAYTTEGIVALTNTNARKIIKTLKNNLDNIKKIFDGENNFPIICLSDEQQKELLKLSLQYEKEIYPEWFALNGTETEHREGFQDYVVKGKFCHWDVKKMLQKKQLQNLMKKIL